MNMFSDVLGLVDAPQAIQRCARGDIKHPLASMSAPAEWYGFPPALIPIWSDGSLPMYWGYWHHWFVERVPTYVRMSVPSGRKVMEIARTAEQFLDVATMMSIVTLDGVKPAVKAFARDAGIAHLAELDAASLVCGDNPKGFTRLRTFSDDVPLASVATAAVYTGDFPIADANEPIRGRNACSFEVADEVLRTWSSQEACPQWLIAGASMPDVFAECLGSGDLRGAWLTLNSSGWSIRQAREAIAKLARAAADRRFDALASTWLSVADEAAGAY